MINELLLNEESLIPVRTGYQLIENKLDKDNFFMSLTLKFPSEWVMYRLIEKKENKNKYVYDEHSKIRFLTYPNFPDGVFIHKTDKYSYKVYVVELKKNAGNKLPDIPKQLHSGVLHAVSLIHLSETTTNSNIATIQPQLNIEYELFVFSGEKVTLPKNKRVVPGRASRGNQRLIDYTKNQVYHNLKGQRNFIFKINRIDSLKKKVQNGQYFYHSQVFFN